MIKIKNGSIIELNMPQDNEIESLEQEIGTKHDNNRYVVMGYQGNGITIVPLEDYKNKIFKNFKYTLFIFLQMVKVVGKIKDEEFNTVLIKAKFTVPYLRQLEVANIKIYERGEKRKLDYKNTEVVLVDDFGYCWRKVKSDAEIKKFDKYWTNVISIKR